MAAFSVQSIDHVVLTVKDPSASVDFYTKHLGMKHQTFTYHGTLAHSLIFGNQKINLHEAGNELEPKALRAEPGSEDLCFITTHSIDEVLESWRSGGIEIVEIEGQEISEQVGAAASLRSVFCRDSDGNLIEVANEFSKA